MSNAPASPDENANLSGLGRALMGTGEGGRPSGGPWIPPTAEELQKELPQYEITRMLGRGGMGAVYMGRQTALDRPVAVKILSGALEEADHGFTERFKNEARAMARLNHPGIVGVYDFGQTASGLLYIVMEYVDGTDVAKMIAKDGRLHTEHAMAITAHVCDALAYAHERGIIHRDIKPANIMVGYDGVVKVADFGLAKVNSSGATSGLTQSNVVMGTLHYMAPEALMLGNAVDHRADIYAVGVMLYQMLTGKIPQGMFELPSLQVKGLDPRYDGIIAKALREDRDKRYGRAVELRHDLDAILTQPVVKVDASADKAPAALQTQARPQRPGGQPYRPPPQRVIVRTEKKSSPLLWIAVVALAAVAAWLYWNRTAPESGSQQPSATVTDKQPAPAVNESSAATTTNPAEAAKDRPFVNSLGMKFVPVPGTKVLMCIHETRYKDFATFAQSNPDTNPSWKQQKHFGVELKVRPEDHPVVNVNWHEATAFCSWLSIKDGKSHRLPTDHEWSVAVGVGDMELPSKLPEAKSAIIRGYPWGKGYPAPSSAGNYSDGNRVDGYPTTSPVMSYASNGLGLFDLGGNVWEWCQDWYDREQTGRVLRGAAWNCADMTSLLSSDRHHRDPLKERRSDQGFRCVIDLTNQSPVAAKASVVSIPTPQPSPASTSPAVQNLPPVIDPPNTIKKVTQLMSAGVPEKRPGGVAWSSVNGEWLSRVDDNSAGIQFPHKLLALDYDYEVEFSFAEEQGGTLHQRVPLAGKVLEWVMPFSKAAARQRFEFTGLSPTAAATSMPSLVVGKRYRSVVQVRQGSISAVVDGQTLFQFQGDPSQGKDVPNRFLDPKLLGLTTGKAAVTLHRVQLTEFIANTVDLTKPPTTGWKPMFPDLKELKDSAGVTELAGGWFKLANAALYPCNARDVAVKARIRNGSSVEMVVRALDDSVKPKSKYLATYLSKNHSLVLFRKWTQPEPAAPRFANITLATSIPPTQPKPDGDYVLTLLVYGDQLRVFMNDELIIEKKDTLLLGSFAGLNGSGEVRDLEWVNLPQETESATAAPVPTPPVATSMPTGPTTWTDTKGRSLTATFKAIASGNVLLDIAGKVTPVPLNTLSPESQKLARTYHDQSNPATTNDPSQATKDRPFMNSLGMKFVPVPGTKVLFCIHETRRVDFAAFAKTNPGVGGNWAIPVLDDKPLVGEPLDHHPVVKVSRSDAESFCRWLSSQSSHHYRLPTDAEWSMAAGFDEPRTSADTPDDLHHKAMSGKTAKTYPWGTEWPPPAKAGNYAGEFTASTDTFPTTAPVMTFQANEHGLYDLGGNVWEWVSGRYWNKDEIYGTLRGGGWVTAKKNGFLSGCRFGERTSTAGKEFGFRVVLELPDASPASSAAAPPAPTSPQAPATTWKPLRAGEYADSRDISIRGRFRSGQFAVLTVRGSEAGEKPESKYWAALQTNGLEVVLFREWIKAPPGSPRFANSTLARTSLKQAIPKNKEYTLTFTAVGDQLKVLVDDIPVIEVVDKMLPGRFAGCLGDPSPASLEWAPAVAP